MVIHAEDLPLTTRKKLGIAKTPNPTRSKVGTGHGAPCPGHCNTCGEGFPTYLAFEKHRCADTVRWVIDLPTAGS